MIDRTHTYILPETDPSNGKPVTKQLETKVNSVVIIGANGSGKSRLGAWIEDNSKEKTRRISAQRSLVFGDSIQQRSYEQAQTLLETGQENAEALKNLNRTNRWGGHEVIDGRWVPKYTTSLLNDYEYVLAAIVALWHIEEHRYIMDCKFNETNGKVHDPVPEMVVDRLTKIWNHVFPHRQISLDDAKVTAKFNSQEYKGKDMSDGERVALYLIAQALCAPCDKTIIIDEPEIHLHRSIMNRLWASIEQSRPDCLFIYITHDTEFASAHQSSDKIWVKSYDGIAWEWVKAEESSLPSDLLLKLLGNRKPVLFVEGNENSYDVKLYQAIYQDYFVVPCGGCAEVIQRTKSYKATSQLNHFQAYGIIDRDFRCETEIESLRSCGVYALKVAEVENLFILREIFQIINKIFAQNNDDAIHDAIRFIIDTKFTNMKEQQIRKATIAEIKYQFSIVDVSSVVSDDSIKTTVESISYERIHENIAKKYQSALDNDDYNEILKLFNQKELSNSVGHFFGGNDKDYSDLVIRLANTGMIAEFREALKSYLPQEIPFTVEEATPVSTGLV